MADFQIERSLYKQGFQSIAGVDEVGRGALFGPVVAAAVILPFFCLLDSVPAWLEEIDDSKLLSPTKRKRMARTILMEAESVGIGVVSNIEIDEKNIHRASLLAMKRAVENLSVVPDILLVDGFMIKEVNYRQIGLSRGDRRSLSIAAASIVAKVLRDGMIMVMDGIFEGYALSKNKGYGTKEHYQALETLGPTLFHRSSFNLKSRSKTG